ncbi:centromere protein F-like [Eublepharis macularius]|uniref:Centromere protein F-like n=1 Tax=Eublepharis macularius TaxID=481883 RepID=A0AA97KST6_EUBMA|nr:centromere protein F-like [Eublepharis macularius]
MSWPAEEWKVGLPIQALRAIAEVERRMERLQKERQQKQVQLDTLEAMMHKQRKKHEEERISCCLLSQQNRSLSEAREQVERARQRLAQELQAKEVQLSCLEGQLVQANRRQAELEEELHRGVHHGLNRTPYFLCPAGDGEVKAEPSRTLAAGSSQIQRSSHLLANSCENKNPVTHWQQETACPAAPPGSPTPTENGEGTQSVAPELVSAGKQLKKDNEVLLNATPADLIPFKVPLQLIRLQIVPELRLALAKAKKQKQETERELWNLQKQFEVTRAELAQWKKQRSGQAEGLLGIERMPPSGSCRSVSSSHLELPPVKRGAAIKLKGPSPRLQSTDQAQEELQALRAEVLMLRRNLDTSESQCKSLLETCWQKQESGAWAQAKQVLSWRASPKQETPEIQGNCHDRARELGLGQGEASVSETVEGDGGGAKVKAWSGDKGGLKLPEVGEAEAEVEMVAVALEQAPGDMPALVEEKDHTTVHSLANSKANCEGKIELEGDMEALRVEIRALAAGKAKAEAQAILAQQKLQSLQATLGKQTERLAQAMETQSCHVEELLTDAEEKDQLMQRLSQELEETKKALDMASAESQRLRVLLREPHTASVSDPHRGSETREVPVEKSQVQPQKGQAGTGLAGHLQGEKRGMKEQLDKSDSWVLQQNQEAWHWQKGDGNVTGPPDLVCSGDSGQAVDVLQAAQKRELWLQGSQWDAQTQTEGPYCGVQRREHISVAFDDTQYEPYGLPEVVMKGFADIPSGPLCPYVLRRGILGSAPVAQLAPRAEPEEDFPEAEEGTGI